MRQALAAALACAAVLGIGGRLAAHHSFAAEFDASQPVRLAGTVSRLEWRNPHAWIYLDVTDPASHIVTWAIEASSPNALARRGIVRQSLSPGATVVVRGYRAKNGTPTARGLEITLPDGRSLSLGSPESTAIDDPAK